LNKRSYCLKKEEKVGKLISYRILILFGIVFLIYGCATTSPGSGKAETYEQWLSQCKDYRDVERWMSRNFSYDIPKLRRKDPKTNTPDETFRTGYGVCKDAAEFAAESLNRINPEYKAGIVRITVGPEVYPHVACFFYLEGKLYVLDYGSAKRKVCGVHGPLKDLQEWADWYSNENPDMKGRTPVVLIETPAKDIMNAIEKGQEEYREQLRKMGKVPRIDRTD